MYDYHGDTVDFQRAFAGREDRSGSRQCLSKSSVVGNGSFVAIAL